MSLVASALKDNSVILEVSAIVQPDSFYDFANREIWDAVVEIHLNRDQIADPVTVWSLLEDRKKTADIGGVAYLVELCASYSNPGAATHYAEIVRDFSIRRNLIHAAADIDKLANDRRADAMKVAEQAEQRIFSVIDKQYKSNAADLVVAISEAEQRIDARLKGVIKNDGVLTGWHDLDDIIGTMENGALVVIAARPGMGKTAFALNMLSNISKRKEHVYMSSLEMKRIEIAERLISMWSGIDSYKFRKATINESEQERAGVAVNKLRVIPWMIDDTPTQSVLQIAAGARRAKLRFNTRAVVVDYMQLIEPDNRSLPRQEQVAAISRRLKILARDLNIPVVVLAQVNRKSEDRAGGRIKISDLRESGAVEQDADSIFLLQSKNDEELRHQDIIEVEVEVGKNRNGPTGAAYMIFNKPTSSFTPKQQGASPY